jgi:K+-sensing histidine kinase KdpD
MKQVKWIYLLVVAYVIAAFSWWTFLLIQDNERIALQESRILLEDVNKARQEAIYLSMLNTFRSENALPFHINDINLEIDTNMMTEHIRHSFSTVDIHFKSSASLEDAMIIQVKPEILSTILQKQKKRNLMFMSEASVFALLLIWGFYIIFKSYQQKVALNRQQMNFLHSVTHELKTPIASAKLILQTIQQRKLNPEKQNELIDKALLDLNRLNDLMERLLIAAKLENHSYDLSAELFNFSDLINRIVRNFEKQKAKNQVFIPKIQDDLFVNGDSFALESVVNNLIENAIKYSPQDGQIEIELFQLQQNNELVFRVIDEGPGIPTTEKNLVTKKFYRIGNEETRNSKGTGLGLFIVNDVIKKHEGKLRILDREPKGCIMEVIIPQRG